MQENIIVSAKHLASLGLPIIPVCSPDHKHTTVKHNEKCKGAGKTPLIAGWRLRQNTTEKDIQEWKRQFKTFNIGLPLGSKSGLCGIDIDGARGEVLLQQMSGGDLPATWEFKTSAGRRLLYQIPKTMKTRKFKQTGEGVHEECALLCEGQQTVVPPSIHQTGTLYAWEPGHSPSDMDCANAPGWLLRSIKAPDDIISDGRGPGASSGLDDSIPAIDPQEMYGDDIIPEDEFCVEDFFYEVPPEVAEDSPGASVKTQKNKKESSNMVEALLYKVINEGARDSSMTQIIGHFLSKQEYRNLPSEMFLSLMLDYNNRYCSPPLEIQAIKDKVNYFTEVEAHKTQAYQASAKRKEFQASVIAQTILNLFKEQENMLIDYEVRTGTFFTCNPTKGPWKARYGTFMQTIRSMVRRYLRHPKYGDPSWDKESYINETLAALKDLIISNGVVEDSSYDLHENQERIKPYIVVQGQLLDWRRNILLPWDPLHKTTTNFDVEFDPNATCPNWEKYMQEWLPDKGSRDLLQEFLGYCLIPDTKLEMFLILTGSGSNGKSMLLNHVKKLFGEACSTLSTSKMVERFGKAALNGKLVNICTEDEGEGGYLKHTAEIKALVSGEEITAEYKGKDLFKFKNVARMIFATNNIPKTRDRSHGWYRRQIIINFPNRFEKDMTKAREMERHMQEEQAGIFNWLLQGLRQVMSRGDLMIPDSISANLEEFKAVNDPLEGFLRECTRRVSEEEMSLLSKSGEATKRIGISTSYLYKVYEFWCEDNYGDRARQLKMVQRTFTERLHKEKGIHKNKGYCIIKKDSKQQCFFGVVLCIQDLDMCERMSNAFLGYGAAEPEARIREFIMQQLAGA